MDKALEKITQLEENLKKLYDEYSNTEDRIDFKKGDRQKLYWKNESLCHEINSLESEENNIKYKLSNIKKWKKFTILKTLFIAIYVIAATLLLNLKLGGSVLGTLICISVGTPLTIWFGESGCYYYNRKYLKKNKLEDVQKNKKEKEKKLSLNNEKIDILELEMTKLIAELDEIKNKINLTKEEISQLKEFRNAVIKEFLKDNEEFDNLVNKEYELQKQKKLNK